MIDKKRRAARKDVLDLNPQLNPEQRICPNYDYSSISYQKVAERGEMGMRVLDNCAEDHAM